MTGPVPAHPSANGRANPLRSTRRMRQNEGRNDCMTRSHWILCLPILACEWMACASRSPAGATSADEGWPMVLEVGDAKIEIEKPAENLSKTSGQFPGWLGYSRPD